MAELLGLGSEKDVIGKTDYELFPKEVADIFRRDDSALFATGKAQVDIQESIPLPDGTRHYIRTTKHLIRTTTGEVMGVYCTGRDITEIKEAYAQLKLLTNSIPGGIATFRCMPGNIETIYFNDGVCKLAGYAREEYAQRQVSVLEVVFDEDRPIIHRQLELLKSGEVSLDFIFRIHTNGGGYKWLNSVATVTEDLGEDNYIVNAVLTDVTAQQEEKERLRLTEEEYRLAIIHSNRTICRYSIPEQTLTISQEAAKRLALPECIPDVPYGRVRLGKISGDTADAYIAFFKSIMHGEKECSGVFRKMLNNVWRWVEARATTIFNDAGNPVSAIISYTDVTEQREKEAVYNRWQNSLAERPPESYSLLRCNLSRGAAFDSCEGKLITVRFDKRQRTYDECMNEYLKKCVYIDDRERFRAFSRADTMLAEYYRGHRTDIIEFRERNGDVSSRWLRLTVDLVEFPHSSDVEAYMMFENIDEQKRTQLRTLEQAETDPLTGVLNRATFAVRVNKLIASSQAGTVHALMMLDIDGFKLVNDIFGHAAGDKTLTDVADILTKSSRKDDLVGRLGGDEFVVFLTDIPNETAAARKARQICELTSKDFNVDVHITSSIGIALFPKDGDDFESLYKIADDTLYRVKDNGKNGYTFNNDEPVTNIEKLKNSSNEATQFAKENKLRRMLIISDNAEECQTLSGIFKSGFRIEKATNASTALIKLRHYRTAISVVLLNAEKIKYDRSQTTVSADDNDIAGREIDGFQVLRRIQQDEGMRTVPVVFIGGSESEDMLDIIRDGAADYITKPIEPNVLRVRVESVINRADNERLRIKNSFISLRDSEIESYKSALEYCGIMLISLDWGKNEFTYSPSVSERLAGSYDGKTFWSALLSNMAADSFTVRQMQQLVHDIAVDRSRMIDGMNVRIKTLSGATENFNFGVFKEVDEFGLADKMVMTLRETSGNNRT